MPLRTGVVGTGTVSRNNHLPAVARNPRTELVAVADADGDSAREAAFEYGARPYVDAESMLADEDLDWVHVATPVATHRELAGAAIEAGVPTTVQKPATVTLDELDELRSMADSGDVPVSVVHNWLYYPVMREARRRLRSGDLGRIRAVETTFAGEGPPDETYRGSWVFDLPGGEFEEGMPHPLYLTMAAGGPPRRLEDVTVDARRADEYDDDVAYDGLTLQYTADGGTLCSVTFLSGSSRNQVVRIHGEDGSLTVDLSSRTIREHAPDDGPYHFLNERLERNATDALTGVGGLVANLANRGKERLEEQFDRHLAESPDGHYALLDETAAALQRGSSLPTPLERSRWTVGIMERVREEVESGDSAGLAGSGESSDSSDSADPSATAGE